MEKNNNTRNNTTLRSMADCIGCLFYGSNGVMPRHTHSLVWGGAVCCNLTHLAPGTMLDSTQEDPATACSQDWAEIGKRDALCNMSCGCCSNDALTKQSKGQEAVWKDYNFFQRN